MFTKLAYLTTSAVFVATLAVAPHAEARQDLGLPATPFESDVLVDDGTSILNNPANAAYQRGLEAGVGLRLTTGDHRGDGYYGYASYTLPFGLNASGLLGVRSGLDHGLVGAASFAWGKGPIALGLRYRVYSHEPGSGYHGLHTSDFGLTLRPWNALAVALVITNLWNPTFENDIGIGRSYRVSLGTRTLRGQLMLGLRAEFLPDEAQAERHLGVELRSRVSDRLNLYASAGIRQLEGEQWDGWSASAGLSFRFDHVAVDAALHRSGPYGSAAGQTDDGWGGAGLIRYVAHPRGTITQSAHQLLRVKLNGAVVERPARGLFTSDRKAWVDQLMEIHRARHDDRFDGVYVHLSGTELGVAQLWELRQELDAIRADGKKVVAYIERGGLRDLYIAASADFVVTSPAFTAEDAGLSIERIYIADLLEKIGIRANFLRVGEYKSAVEMFTRNTPSEASDTALHAYISTVWHEISTGLCRGRASAACPGGEFPLHAPIHADSLLASGWSQRTGYEDELRTLLFREYGNAYTTAPYAEVVGDEDLWRARPTIAVIHITGMIMDGGSGSNPLTGGSFTGDNGIDEAVQAVLDDPQIQGVIIRVSSPGGSAFASDEMLRSLQRLHDRKIPLRISMGNEAASGGYYVTAFPARIYATPTTLTGSIGIYAGTFELDDLLARVGVNRTYEQLGGPSRLFRGREWSEADMRFMQEGLDFSYRRFVTLVARARELSFDDADAIARGRIWSGEDAKTHGLVHAIGSFTDAYEDLCKEIPACRRAPLSLQHMNKDRVLPLPAPLSMALAQVGLAQDGSNLASVLDNLGLRGPLAQVLLMAPRRAGEARYDLGGTLEIRFE